MCLMALSFMVVLYGDIQLDCPCSGKPVSSEKQSPHKLLQSLLHSSQPSLCLSRARLFSRQSHYLNSASNTTQLDGNEMKKSEWWPIQAKRELRWFFQTVMWPGGWGGCCYSCEAHCLISCDLKWFRSQGVILNNHLSDATHTPTLRSCRFTTDSCG